MWKNGLRKAAALTILLTVLVSPLCIGAAFAYETQRVTGVDFGAYGQQAYAYLQYLDRHFPDRYSDGGRDTEAAVDWIVEQLRAAGYADGQIELQAFTFEGEDEDEYTGQNIIATLPGQTDTQIIVGAHYDGEGAGDNGSGTALLLEAACRLVGGEPPPHSLVFIFFGAEENDGDGSAAYAEAMSRNEVARTAFMINMDSLICGDYCYLYGGVADFEHERVEQLGAFNKVYAISQQLGLGLRLIPWTFDNPAPGFDTPDYPSPSTGDWSDHISFAERGIEYVYLEASNWDIPGPDRQYDGDSETAEAGRIMHSGHDTLPYIEKLFPGRALYHLQVFGLLLNAVLTQP